MSEAGIAFLFFVNMVWFIWLLILSLDKVSNSECKSITEFEINWRMKCHMENIHKLEKRCDYFPIEQIKVENSPN